MRASLTLRYRLSKPSMAIETVRETRGKLSRDSGRDRERRER